MKRKACGGATSSTTPAAALPTTLQEAVERLENTAAATKRRKSRSLDDAVSKAIADNFGTFTDAEIDLTLVRGKSLRETIMDAKMRQRNGEDLAIGKTFYQRLREEFGQASDVGRQMTVKNDAEEEDTNLRSCLMTMLRHNRDTTHIVQWMLNNGLATQKNFVALCRGFLMIAPAQSIGNATLILEFLRYCSRVNSLNAYPTEMRLMKQHFDLALQKSHSHMKSQGQPLSVWWSSVRDFVGCILPVADVDTLLSCKSSWSDVKDALDRVVAAADVGAKMFSSARRQLQEDISSKMLQDAVDALRVKNLTVDVVNEATDDIKEKLKEKGVDAVASFPRREIEFQYRGVKLKTQVHSLMDEWQVRKEAMIREVAVRSGLLDPLWCESELAPPAPALTAQVAPALLIEVRRMRKSAQDYLPTLASQTSERIQEVLQRRASVLVQLDRYCRIECLFFAKHIGPGAEARMHESILQCLPVLPDERTMGACLQALQTLGEGKLYAFCGSGLQAAFSTVKNFLTILNEGRMPPWHQATESDFFKKVKSAFANFLQHERECTDGRKILLHGALAAKGLFGEFSVVAAGENGAARLRYDELSRLTRYKWLLTNEQAMKVDEWVNVTLAQAPEQSVGSGEKCKSAGNQKSKKHNADVKAIVGNLFK